MKNLSLATIGLVLCVLCKAQTAKHIDWIADIDFLAKELPKNHYDLFTVRSKSDFSAGLDKIKLQSSASTNFEVAVKLQQLLASFGDSHSGVSYGQLIDKSQLLPLHLYWFSDGLYILQSTAENSEIVGQQIVSVNGVPLKTVTESLSTLVVNENQALIRTAIPQILPSVQILKYFGFAEGAEVQLGLMNRQGIEKNYTLRPGEMNRPNRKIFLPDSLALCFKNDKAFFIDYYQEADNIYYLQYNRCWSKELEMQLGNPQKAVQMPSFSEFEEKIFRTLREKPIKKLVIDVRFNGGGSSVQGRLLAQHLADLPKKNTKIRVYVILGKATFSSAVLNALDLKRLTNATFVGEETSGKPNHFGEVKNFKLPASGIKINYSTKYFRRSGEKAGTITPDVKQEMSFNDFVRGVDPAYEWIRKDHEAM